MTSADIAAYAQRHGLSFRAAASELGKRSHRRKKRRRNALSHEEIMRRRPDLRAEQEEEERREQLRNLLPEQLNSRQGEGT